MPATVKQLITPDAAAAELWQVAESGDVAELLLLLPRIGNVNVRNRHGTTALMKASFRGHEPMVRALLEQGADPNLMRNDRFTALALAAFCGHIDTVKTLIEHGARTEVETRCGASARGWAIARTYSDVAECLEAPAPARVKHRPARVVDLPPPVVHTPLPVERETVAPPVVHTLKDPPEIWDLVHEAPRNFNRWSAFVSRITSMKRTTALGFVVVLILLVGGLGAFVLKGSRTRELVKEIPTAPNAATTVVSEPAAPSASLPAPVPQQAAAENPAVDVVPNKARVPLRPHRSDPSRAAEAPLQTAQGREAPVVATPQIESPKPIQTPAKTSPVNPLSPNLIAPAKPAPPKGKVIQWP